MQFRSARVVLFSVASVAASLTAAEPHREIPPAAGPHVNLAAKDFAGSKSFTRTDRIVGTYYFYWYDAASKAHIIDGDGTDALTTHPPALDDFSYRSVRWHRRQLEDMMAAGIDVVLPVFWGAPSEQGERAHLNWSYAGLGPLVAARDEWLREGRQPPRIGLFYDTSTLRHNSWNVHVDLATEYGRRWFYATIRDFYSMVPPRHWAMIDGRPIVLLYSAAFAKRQDQGAIDFTKAEFPKQFGGRVPWIAREISWNVTADSVVAWGGALGLKNPGGIASLGPGYDHSAVPGRAPLVVDRRGGQFYQEEWLKFLRRPSNFVMVETWNEFHEGTDVAESKEFGRQYIDLTRKYAALFKTGWKPPLPEGRFSRVDSVSISLGATNAENGLRHVDHEDGLTAPASFAGRAAREVKPGKAPGRYIYFGVDDSFKTSAAFSLTVTVEFFDAAPGTLDLEFDGSDSAAPFGGAYTRSPDTTGLEGSRTWLTARFRLPNARLLNGQNGGADFRLVVRAPALGVGRVTLSR